LILLYVFNTLLNRRLNLNQRLLKIIEEKTEENIKQNKIIQQQAKMTALGEMLSSIAHQWRQPLNILYLKKDLFIDRYFQQKLTDEIVEKFDQETSETIAYLSNTIDDFRNFFKPDKEKVEFELNEIILGVKNIVSSQMDSHYINFQINKSDDFIYFFGYPSELQQVIINLVLNAKDILIQQEDNQNKKIVIDIKKLDDEIIILVKDSGGGVSKDIIDKIFEPYFTTKGNMNGSGLGLYMSKNIIENNMNGFLSVENNQEGAVFTIKLKIAK
jgi:signal transduction histidine kinase